MIQHALFFLAVLLFAQDALGETYTINTEAKWEKWRFPKGVVQIRDDGRVSLVALRRKINAALDAPQFLWYSDVQKKKVPGGVITGSNPAAAANLIDGRYETYWNPRPQDPLEQWTLTVNLGRMVAATKIRLVFADTLGLKPFEQFAVYRSEGAKLYGGADLVRYTLVGRTLESNRQRVVEYPLSYTEARDTTSTGVSLGKSFDFAQVQFIQIVFTGRTEKGALAEVEVEALGDNIALGTYDRFGTIDAHVQEEFGAKIFDGDASTVWIPPNVPDTEWNSGPKGGTLGRPQGAWFEWDLGATFWVDQIVTFFGQEGRFGMRNNAARPEGYIIQTSDGSPRPGGVNDAPGGRFNYFPLIDVWNRDMPYRYQFSHEIDPPSRVRWIFWRHAHGSGIWGRGQVTFYEMQVYGEGFPAEAMVTSSLIDADLIKATQGKNITSIAWDTDIPQGAKIEIQSKAGNTAETKRQYFNKDGKEITAREYGRLPANLKGDSLITISPGLDWSDWSDIYSESGRVFLSPSPRQYLQFQIKLISERPDVTPILRSLSIRFANPLVKDIKGVLQPREIEGVDRLARYAYGIWPVVETGNPGFDWILIKSIAGFEREGIVVEIKKKPVEPISIDLRGDSLLIKLSQAVRGDSVTVRFGARVRKNATAFEAFVGTSTTPGSWQFVDPLQGGATTVFLPALSETETLFENIIIDPPILTPNGDGVNEQATISFLLVKVERKEPRVAIYDLQGGFVRELERSAGEGYRYLWDGQGQEGRVVPPGLYVCRISINAEAGRTVENRTIGVIY